MFLGQYKRTMDAKGRLVVPARYRHELSSGCVITKGQERCLAVFTPSSWEQRVARYEELRRSSEDDPEAARDVRSMRRSAYAAAAEQAMDAAGRIQLPAHLRKFAGLGRKVTVIGVHDRAEIWNSEAWEEYEQAADDHY